MQLSIPEMVQLVQTWCLLLCLCSFKLISEALKSKTDARFELNVENFRGFIFQPWIQFLISFLGIPAAWFLAVAWGWKSSRTHVGAHGDPCFFPFFVMLFILFEVFSPNINRNPGPWAPLGPRFLFKSVFKNFEKCSPTYCTVTIWQPCPRWLSCCCNPVNLDANTPKHLGNTSTVCTLVYLASPSMPPVTCPIT